MAVSVNLEKALDKAFENATIAEVLAAPPSALAGLTAAADEQLLAALKVKTIADLGNNKYIRLAVALADLGDKEG